MPEIASADPLEELVEKLGADYTADGWYSALCPFHDDKHSSLYFDATHFICYSCNEEGDIEKLIRKVNEKG